MRTRPTARVILIDPGSRVLLMRFKDFHEERHFWATIGGGLNPDEAVLEGALREAREETGLEDLRPGPTVWYGEVTLLGLDRLPTLMQEHYVVMHTSGGPLSDAGWEDLEREFVKEMRWWSLEAIARSTETIYPLGFANLLRPVLAGDYPVEPIVLPLRS